MSKSWLQRCDIKYCKNNTFSKHETTTVHPTPRCPKLFHKWEKEVSRIGMRLPRSGRICERHFDPEDIMEFLCSKREKGSSDKMVTENVKLRVLVNGAVPKKFDDEIAEYLKEKGLQGEGGEIETDVNKEEAEKTPPKKRPRKHLIKSVPKNNETEQEKVIPRQKTAEEKLFEKIYTGQIEPRLPSRAWNIHNCQLPEKGFVFTEIAVLSPDHSVPPLFRKSVYFDGSFNMRVYLIGKYFPNVVFKRPKTIRDVEELLGNINAIKLCEGGPHLSATTNLKSAYKDERMYRWRHVDCELRLNKGHVCKNCSNLRKIIDRSVKNEGNTKEIKKIKEDEIEDMEGYEIEYLEE